MDLFAALAGPHNTLSGLITRITRLTRTTTLAELSYLTSDTLLYKSKSGNTYVGITLRSQLPYVTLRAVI